ncbi:hypothetical protein PENTCL1PPCAC_3247, partial [Pristionchus entomophagus]
RPSTPSVPDPSLIIIMNISPLLRLLLAALTVITQAYATEGFYSVQLSLSALSPQPVRTTVTLHGVEKSASVTRTSGTTEFTLDFMMTSDQVEHNDPILLDVSTVTDSDFKTETVELTRDSPRVHSIAGLVRIVSKRSQCAKNWYGHWCSTFCSTIEALHQTCEADGRRKCMPGWHGQNCEEKVCPVACKHGHCDGHQCRCRPGFAGPACDQCIPAAGCMSGACRNNTPGTCACRDGWAGPLCNIDLSLCSKHSPCAAGSTCIVKAPGKTVCICPEGKTGANCDIPSRHECPCKNGGQCLAVNGRSSSPVCKCPSGFGGPTCDLPIPTVPISSPGQQQENLVSHNLLVVLNVLLCLVVLGIGLVLIYVALRFIKTARICGPAPSSEESSQPKQQLKLHQPKTSTVSLLMPDDDSAPSSPFKGDGLFAAAKEHSAAKKVVVFDLEDTRDEPRYSACPKKSSIFLLPSPTPIPDEPKEKTYESLPV